MTAYINLKKKWDLSRIIQFLTLVAILQKVMIDPATTGKHKREIALVWSYRLAACGLERACARERVWQLAAVRKKNPSHCTMAGHRAREVVYWTDKTRTTPVSVQTERAQCLAHHGAVDRKGNNNSRAKWSFTLFSLPLLLPSHIQSTISFWPAVKVYYLKK